MDSGHPREDASAPSYDSSDEWEIGLGNLIIDLDADLEKDGQHEGAVPPHPDAASPIKVVGKMKIKRKVSSNAAKGEGASPGPAAATAGRKDSNASSSTRSSTPEDPAMQDQGGCTEDKTGKAAAKTSSISGSQSGSGSGCGPTIKQEVVAGTSSQRQEKQAAPSVAIKQLPSSSGSTLQAKAGGLTLAISSPIASQASSSPAPAPAPASTSAPPRPNVLPIAAAEGGKQPRAAKGGEEGEGEEGVAKKMKMDKEVKGDTVKRTGEASCSGRKHGGKKAKVDKPQRASVGVDTMDIGVATEPESIGPCEPGTAVNLEGIVWHETDQGVLVVNVTWRNKTYVGTLMDCTRHDWAAPRFCDSPTSDMENRNKGTGRPKRGRNTNSSSSDLSNYTETRSSIHSKLRTSTKGRRNSNASNGTRTPPCTLEKGAAGKRKTKEMDVDDSAQTSKRQKTGVRPSSSASDGRQTPVLIECPQPNCNKKYKHKNGLHYHLSHAHNSNLDKDGNWRERNEDNDEDSRSNASDDVPAPLAQPKDKKKELKDRKESSKEEERMDIEKGSDRTSEIPSEESSSSAHEGSLPEAMDDSAADSAGQRKSDSAKNKEGMKSPKSNKTHIDKFTAGMKCLGIPKPKEAKSSPSKAPKTDPNSDKSGKSAKKQTPSSSDKDLSIFDFNATSELDDQGTAAVGPSNAMEKHVNVSVIRPTPETGIVKQEPVSPTSLAKTGDHTKGPKQHNSSSTSSDHGTEDKSVKRTDKEKAKSDKHKKGKHDKMVMKTGKPIRPIAPAPSAAPAPPPQLIAIPTSLVQPSVAVTCTLNVAGINTIAANPQPVAVNPSLKPIQPKPVTSSSVTLHDASVNPTAFKDKDRKPKQKKRLKSDKDKERDGKDKLPASPSVTKEQCSEQRLKTTLLPAVPETNILKQALTASGIVEPDSNPSEKSKVVAPEAWKRDSNKTDSPVDRVLPTSQEKNASVAPVGGSSAIPQIPKLIPTSSVPVPSSRVPKQHPLPPQQHPYLAHQGQSPSHPPQGHVQPPVVTLPAVVKPGVSKTDGAGHDRASSNISVHTGFAKEGQKPNQQLLSPPSGHRTGNISPAYSDISEDGVDEQSKQAKSSQAFSFERQDHAKLQVDPSQRIIERGTGAERMPVFHSTERKGTPDSASSGTVQGNLPLDRDDGRKGNRKDQNTPRSTLNPVLPASVPHVYPGAHYPYLHGYVNHVDPSYHMRLMASDPQHKQQPQDRLSEEQRKRPEQLRGKEPSKKKSESEPELPEKRRPIVSLQTEPITPPQPSRHPEARDRGREKELITKSRHLDFPKKDGSSPSSASTPDSEKPNSAALLAERQREEMRQYYLYQQKLIEQHQQVEEGRKSAEQDTQQKYGADMPKKDLATLDMCDKTSRVSPAPAHVSNPTKDTCDKEGVAHDKRDSRSPSGKVSKLDEQRKLLEGFPYLQAPYPYGAIPYDPSHPTFQPMVYPAFLHPDLRYPPTTSAVGPSWKPPVSEKGCFESEPDRRSSSPLRSSIKGAQSPEALEAPARPLDILQHHTNQYFSPAQKHTGHSPSSRPRTPEKGRTTPGGQRSRSSSPAARKTPTEIASASSTSSSSSSSSITATREGGRRQDSSSPTVHQHMHTHQHTHVGVGVGGVSYPVLPYVLASQHAAAAAAASASAAAYAVRRDKS